MQARGNGAWSVASKITPTPSSQPGAFLMSKEIIMTTKLHERSLAEILGDRDKTTQIIADIMVATTVMEAQTIEHESSGQYYNLPHTD